MKLLRIETERLEEEAVIQDLLDILAIPRLAGTWLDCHTAVVA